MHARRWAARLVTFAACCVGVSSAWAGIADVLRDPRFARLELAPIAPALANTVASTYPVASASSSVTYVFDPELDAPVRQPGVAGPVIGERARTLGRGQWDIAGTYSYVHLTTINGDDMDSLVNKPRVNGRTIVFPVKGGITLKDGRFTNFLPVRVVADLDVRAHIFAPSLTYGLTPDLDLNIVVPLLQTSLGVTAHTQTPDPRFPQFALPPGNPNAQQGERSLSDEAFGVGDVLLRAKYMLFRSRWVDGAAGLGLSLPTGNQADLQGTGTTRVQPALIFSQTFWNRVEPLLNVGVDCNADNVDRSVVRWATGGTAQLLDRLSLSLVFLGRHELARQTDPIPTPFFFQIERNDQYDASIGLRWRFAESGFVGLNAIVPLERSGLRADAIPTAAIEYAF